MQVVGDTQLVAIGTHLSEITATSSPNSDAGNLMDFIGSYVNGMKILFEWLSADESVDNIFETIFQIIVQDQSSLDKNESQSLREGFRLLNELIMTMHKHGGFSGNEVNVRMDSAQDYQKFLGRARRVMAERKVCFTNDGFVGLVPNHAEPGDQVVRLNGSDTTFVLRANGEEDGKSVFKLVGWGYFCIHGKGEMRFYPAHEGNERMVLI
jgi:hypothetical protein